MDEEDSDPCPPADETALLAEAVARHGAPLAALHADWLGPQLDSEAGTAGVLAALQARFDAPGFARSCGRADADADAAAPPPPLLPPPPGPRVDVTSRSWWSWSRAALGLARPGAPPPPPPPNDPAALAEALLAAPPDPEPEPLTSYVLIEHEDALDALVRMAPRRASLDPR